MTKPKPYKAKSKERAEAEVRRLRRQRDELMQLSGNCYDERRMLAKLAADGPCFYNPLEAAAAKRVRDEILRQCGLAPDGKPLK